MQTKGGIEIKGKWIKPTDTLIHHGEHEVTKVTPMGRRVVVKCKGIMFSLDPETHYRVRPYESNRV